MQLDALSIMTGYKMLMTEWIQDVDAAGNGNGEAISVPVCHEGQT